MSKAVDLEVELGGQMHDAVYRWVRDNYGSMGEKNTDDVVDRLLRRMSGAFQADKIVCHYLDDNLKKVGDIVFEVRQLNG